MTAATPSTRVARLPHGSTSQSGLQLLFLMRESAPDWREDVVRSLSDRPALLLAFGPHRQADSNPDEPTGKFPPPLAGVRTLSHKGREAFERGGAVIGTARR